jgi:adenylate cyclase
MSHEALIQPIREWLIDQALGEPDIIELFETMCRRLAGIGLPIARGRLIWQTLHPLFRAEQVLWNKGEPASLDQFAHQDNETDAWRESPLRFVLENNLQIFRRKLHGPGETLDFPMLHELKAGGITDYLVLATAIENIPATGVTAHVAPRGVIATWASDRPDGFSSDDLNSLQSVQRVLALASKMVIQARVSQNIASTYLGSRAGRSVLNGQIRRGDGETTNAVVWISDLRNSTMSAEAMPSEVYFAMLNTYFEATAGPIVDHGGEILDFIGDAVLGIFPYEDEAGMVEAADRAHAALKDALAKDLATNAEREKQGLERYKFGVGLNVGNVKFGNIGIPQRLSFSVIGHTVNEVSRIESMTKYLQQPVLAGGGLARLGPEYWRSVGAHKLEGVLEPVELFAFRGDNA